MKLLLFHVFLASVLTGSLLPAQTNSHPIGDNHSSLHLLLETASGMDYKNREYSSYTWNIKNTGSRSIWLPLPKSRLAAKSTPPRHFAYRTKVSGSWTSGRLVEHEVNYEADWVVLPPGEKHPLMAVTFYKEDARFEEVEVSVSYRDEAGRMHKKRLSWKA